MGGKRTSADPCVYVFGKKEERVIVIIYVDDIILASKELSRFEYVKSKLKSTFKMTDLGQVNNILGINEQREGATGRMHLSQEKYIEELLEKFNMKHAIIVSTPTDTNLKITKEMSPTTEEERQEMQN